MGVAGLWLVRNGARPCSARAPGPTFSHLAIAESPRNPLAGRGLVAVDVVGVPLEQHRQAVPQALSYLGCGNTSGEHPGCACVAQVVRSAGERDDTWCGASAAFLASCQVLAPAALSPDCGEQFRHLCRAQDHPQINCFGDFRRRPLDLVDRIDRQIKMALSASRPVLPGAVFLAARLSRSRPPRLGRSLRSRRMRSAAPSPDPESTHLGLAPIEDDGVDQEPGACPAGVVAHLGFGNYGNRRRPGSLRSRPE